MKIVIDGYKIQGDYHLLFGVNWEAYLIKGIKLTREGKRIKSLVDNALKLSVRVELYKLRKRVFEDMAIEESRAFLD